MAGSCGRAKLFTSNGGQEAKGERKGEVRDKMHPSRACPLEISDLISPTKVSTTSLEPIKLWTHQQINPWMRSEAS
jgi:hypothetical protein